MRKNKKKRITFKNLRLISFILLILFIPVLVIFVQKQQEIRQRAETTAEFQLSSNTKKVSAGETLLLAIAVDSKANPINAVQVNLAYPPSKLDVQNINATQTAFIIESENIYGNGLIKIGRETAVPVVGENHIATIRFTTKQETSAQEIALLPGSFATRSTDNINILAGARLIDSSLVVKNLDHASNQSFFAKAIEKNTSIWDYFVNTFLPSLFSIFKR